MAEVITCLDRWTRQITLEESIWRTKIAIPGRIPAHCLPQLEDTIANPDFVTFDKMHANRECFYKAGVLPAPQHRTYLKVVVEFYNETAGSPDSGFVVTAFPVGRIHRREVLKWP